MNGLGHGRRCENIRGSCPLNLSPFTKLILELRNIMTLAVENLGPRLQGPIEICEPTDSLVSYNLFASTTSTASRIAYTVIARRAKLIRACPFSFGDFMSTSLILFFGTKRISNKFFIKNWSSPETCDCGTLRVQNDEKVGSEEISQERKTERTNRHQSRCRCASVFQRPGRQTTPALSKLDQSRAPRANEVWT